MGRVFNFRSGCMHTMHLLSSVRIQPNLELKTRPNQLLGSLPLVITLPEQSHPPYLGYCPIWPRSGSRQSRSGSRSSGFLLSVFIMNVILLSGIILTDVAPTAPLFTDVKFFITLPHSDARTGLPFV
jgi:hypothetical protein